MNMATIPLTERACEIPEYQIVDRIQPHATLVTFDWPDLEIVHLSANAGQVFALPPEEILGTSLADYLDPDSLAHLTSIVAAQNSPPTGFAPQVVPGLRVRQAHTSELRRFDGWICRSNSKLCLEFHAPAARDMPLEISEFDFVRMLGGVCNFHGSEDALATSVCDAIQRLTGFDRVYLCTFGEAGHGNVEAESLLGHFPSLLYHNFPATDIPQKVRSLYVRNRFRLIPDSRIEPCEIMARPGCDVALDLSDSLCREIGSTHLQYLRNMGVVASTSFSVVNDNRLVALFGAHHHVRRQLSLLQLLRCTQLADSYSDRVSVLRLHRHQKHLSARHAQIVGLAQAFEIAECEVTKFAAASLSQLTAPFDADSVIALDGDQVFPGELSKSDARHLLTWCAGQLTERELLQTDALSRDHPEFAHLQQLASGICAIPLDRIGRRLIVLIRHEVMFDRKWAGNPGTAVSTNVDGGLSPRKSFMTYVENVTGTSRPWKSHHVALANALQFSLRQALESAGLRDDVAGRTEQLRLANQDLQRTIAALKASEKENRDLALIAMKTSAIVIVLDAMGRIDWVNAAFTALFDFALEEVRKKPLAAVMHGAETGAIEADAIEMAISDGNDFEVEILNYSKVGCPVWVEVSGTAVRDADGVVRRFIIVERDTTARRAEQFRLAEALASEREAAAHQRRFISTVSHEFRTPLAIIDSAVQRLEALQPGSEPKIAKHYRRVREAIVRMTELIGRTLSSVRLEDGQFALNRIDFDLKALLAEICERQCQITPLFDIALQSPDRDFIVEGDPKLLDQVFSNLLSNAVKFSGTSRRVEISLAGRDKLVDIAVRDFGIGVAADELPRLFGQFYRTHAVAGLPGAGLGLHLVHKLVTLHEGTVTVESELGCGSTFTVALPAPPSRSKS